MSKTDGEDRRTISDARIAELKAELDKRQRRATTVLQAGSALLVGGAALALMSTGGLAMAGLGLNVTGVLLLTGWILSK